MSRAGWRYVSAGRGVGHLERAAGHISYNRVQRAYRAYVDHGRTCPVCAVDSGVCATASGLWTAYREAHDE